MTMSCFIIKLSPFLEFVLDLFHFVKLIIYMSKFESSKFVDISKIAMFFSSMEYLNINLNWNISICDTLFDIPSKLV